MNAPRRRWVPLACLAVLIAGCGLPAIDVPEGEPRAKLEPVERSARLEVVERTETVPGKATPDQPRRVTENKVDSAPPSLPSNPDNAPRPGDTPGPGVDPRDPRPSPPAESTPPAGTTRPELRLHLSVGTALPQSLPSGTAMFFSVDYEVLGGQPSASTRYYFVVTPARAKPIVQAVKLQKRRGRLISAAQRMLPTAGPFHAHVEAGNSPRSRRAISPKITLKTVGRG